MGKLGVGALGKADGGITIAKRGFEGSTELQRIEEAADIGFGEMGFGHSFDFVADLFYRKRSGAGLNHRGHGETNDLRELFGGDWCLRFRVLGQLNKISCRSCI